MADSVFDSKSEIIEDAEVFEEDYTPDEILCRDEMMDEYVKVLRPIYKGRPPKNAFLYGDTGVGKTAVTKRLTDQLISDIKEQKDDHTLVANEFSIVSDTVAFPHEVSEEDDVDLTIIQLNCQNLPTKSDTNSSYQVAIAMVNEMRHREDKIATTGYAPQAVYNMLYEEIDRVGGTFLVVLDEVDAIGTDDTILYELPRSRSNGDIHNARIGVIGISNDYTFRKNLSPKVQDTLCEREIRFPAYEAQELGDILAARCEVGLVDGSYSEENLRLASALARRDSSGSARKAIDIIKRAAEIAEDQGATELKDTYIREAHEDLQQGDMVSSITHQDSHKLIALGALAEAERLGQTPIRTKTFHEAYQKFAEGTNTEALTLRGFHNHLSRLSMFGFVEELTNNEGRKGGRYNEYQFSEDLSGETVKEAFDTMNDIEWVTIRIRPGAEG